MRTGKSVARPIFQEIKAFNDRVQDPNVATGKLMFFYEKTRQVNLLTAMTAVNDPERTVTMVPFRYVKATKLAVVVATCLGGSVPYIDNIALQSLAAIGKGAPIKDVAALQEAWANSELL